MLSTLLLVLTIWILLSLIIVFPLAKLMHAGSGEGPEGLLTEDNDPAQKGRRHSRHRTRPKLHRAELPIPKRKKDGVFRRTGG